jgi:hypothetical protein
MKKIMSVIVFALVDIVCFLQGGVILAYALLHINYKVEIVRGEGLTTLEMQNIQVAIGGYYYYSDQYIKVALIGTALLITGFLMRSWRKSFD